MKSWLEVMESTLYEEIQVFSLLSWSCRSLRTAFSLSLSLCVYDFTLSAQSAPQVILRMWWSFPFTLRKKRKKEGKKSTQSPIFMSFQQCILCSHPSPFHTVSLLFYYHIRVVNYWMMKFTVFHAAAFKDNSVWYNRYVSCVCFLVSLT